MIRLERTNSNHPAFQQFVRELDREFIQRYPHLFESFAPIHRIVDLATVVVAFDDELPVGCGCFRLIDEHTIEIKRMYVLPAFRNRGIAAGILKELENWGGGLGCDRVQLETGILQPEAIRLYEKSGYTRIENYEPYAGVAESICMEKKIRS